jgi:hypothetical protein
MMPTAPRLERMKIVALKVHGNNWDRGRLARPRQISLTDKITPRRQKTVHLPTRDEITK